MNDKPLPPEQPQPQQYGAPHNQPGTPPPPPASGPGQAPYGARPQGPYTTPAPPLPPKPAPPAPTLPNSIGLTAVGISLLITAIALGVAMSSLDLLGAKSILLGAGLIIILTGGVLAYAALKGLRAGWFLGFSIAGALIALPVLTLGLAVTGFQSYENGPGMDGPHGPGREMMFDEDEFGPDWDRGPWDNFDEDGFGPGFNSDSDDFGRDGLGVNRLDWETRVVAAYNDSIVLDLRDAPSGEDLQYTINLEDSKLRILLLPDQLPVINLLQTTDTAFSARSCEPNLNDDVLQKWLDADFDPKLLPSGTGSEDPANNVEFDLDLYDTDVEFVFCTQDSADKDGTGTNRDNRHSDQRNSDQRDSDQRTPGERSPRGDGRN